MTPALICDVDETAWTDSSASRTSWTRTIPALVSSRRTHPESLADAEPFGGQHALHPVPS